MSIKELAYMNAIRADDALQVALEAAYGKKAGDMRYVCKLPDRIELLRKRKKAADKFRHLTSTAL